MLEVSKKVKVCLKEVFKVGEKNTSELYLCSYWVSPKLKVQFAGIESNYYEQRLKIYDVNCFELYVFPRWAYIEF